MATSTMGTRSKTAGTRAAPTESRTVDGRMRFAWLDQNQATVLYQGEECIINVGTRKTPFRGGNLIQAVNAGMTAIPLQVRRSGRPTTARNAGK